MKRYLKLLSFGLVFLFALIISVNAKDISNYADLKTCLEDTENSICKITKDITPLDGDVKTIDISGEKTLDLNTYTLTMSNSISVLKDGNLTITGNGKILSSEAGKLLCVLTGSKLNVVDGEIKTTKSTGRAIYIKGDNGTLKTKVSIGKNANIISNYALMVASSDNDSSVSDGVVVDIYGTITALVDNPGWEYGGLAIYINGNIKKNSDNTSIINIHDGAMVEGKKAPAIYAAGYLIWNIDNANITGDEGLSIKSGKFILNSTTLNANGAYVKPDEVECQPSGTETTGAAISITSKKNNGEVELSLKDVKATSKNGYALFETITCGTSHTIKSIAVDGGKYIGKVGSVYSNNNLTKFIKSGEFNHDFSTEYLQNNSIKIKLDNNYHVNVARNITIKKVENGTISLKDEKIEQAIEGQNIEITSKPNEGYYLKNLKLVNVNDKTEFIDITNKTSFTMPNHDVVIEAEYAEYLDINKNGNIITTKPSLEVNANISKDITDELGEVLTDETLMEAIDEEKVLTNDEDIVEVKIETKLESIIEEDGKLTISYIIKPVYSVNGQSQGILSNNMLNGKKIKIKLPVPNTTTETHAKVTHKDNDGKVISEDVYEIKTDENGNKYIEIETSSFSEFIVNLFTPVNEINNPKTFNSLTISIIALMISFAILSSIFIVLKNKKVFNK